MARDTFEDQDAVDAEPKKEGLANGVVIVTTILLIGAFVVMQQGLKKHFNAGMFADKTAPAPP
jgi:hypothetical protein